LEQALAWMAFYGGLGEQSITLNVNKEFGVSMMGPQEMQAMLSAVSTGFLSRETFLSELARRGVIQSDIDVADEIERIENEAPNLGVGSSIFNEDGVN